jgi:MarR family
MVSAPGDWEGYSPKAALPFFNPTGRKNCSNWLVKDGGLSEGHIDGTIHPDVTAVASGEVDLSTSCNYPGGFPFNFSLKFPHLRRVRFLRSRQLDRNPDLSGHASFIFHFASSFVAAGSSPIRLFHQAISVAMQAAIIPFELMTGAIGLVSLRRKITKNFQKGEVQSRLHPKRPVRPVLNTLKLIKDCVRFLTDSGACSPQIERLNEPQGYNLRMPPEKSDDFLVHRHLEILGVSLLSEWDVLAFLYCHGTSLTSAAQIAHLLGHDRAVVSAALDRLGSLGLIQRSRGSQGVRLYQFSIPADDASRCSSFEELTRVAANRQGRLLLLKHLQRGSPLLPVRAGGLRLAGKEASK